MLKQGVALTVHNTTGPPCAAPWWVTLHMRVLQTMTTDDDRRQWQLLAWPPYTMCRWASNKTAAANPNADVVDALKQLSRAVFARPVCKQLTKIKWTCSLGEQLRDYTSAQNHHLTSGLTISLIIQNSGSNFIQLAW